MFRVMRKTEREMDRDEAEILLKVCEYGVLSTIGDNGFPYGAPFNFYYSNDNIYIRTTDGYKIDNIQNNDKVSFCVVGEAKELTTEISTYYESVIVFGRAKVIVDEEAESAITSIKGKYNINGKDLKIKDNEDVVVIKIEIEYETGKLRKGYK